MSMFLSKEEKLIWALRYSAARDVDLAPDDAAIEAKDEVLRLRDAAKDLAGDAGAMLRSVLGMPIDDGPGPFDNDGY